MSDFVHLHVHTHYSALDGLGTPEEYIKRTKELGMNAIAITDHGNTSGIYEMQKQGDKHNIKAILGSEFYFNHESIEKRGHLVILAKNNNGLRNIYKMQEKAYVDNFYYKPRIDMKILREHCSDIIVTSACLANQIPQHIMNGDYAYAKEVALELYSVLGDDFYLEMQPNSIPEQYLVNKELIRLHSETGISLVATNDVHYTFKEDGKKKPWKDGIEYSTHDILMASQFNKKISDPDRFAFEVQDFWLKSEKEMYEAFSNLDRDFVEQAMKNTRKIADQCNARIEKGNFLPKYHGLKDDNDAENKLRKLVTKKYKEKIIPKDEHNKEFFEDVKNELNVVSDMGYAGYFLVVQDFVNWARREGIAVGDGRGSGVGSKIGYILDISTINPQQFNLLFERFLCENRIPDMDLDFSDIDAIFEYLQGVYGIENVGRIATFGTLTARACTRKVLSIFDHSQATISKVNGSMPDRPSFTLEEALKESEELREYKKKYHKEFEVIERLEGTISHSGTHAGGVIIWEELSDVLPVLSNTEDRSKRIVGFDMNQLEELGHFKFDILGLQTLEVIERTLENIKNSTGESLDLNYIDYEDKNVYDMLSRGELTGVFQLENQVGAVMEQKPRNFEDIIVINAIIRPGVADMNEYIARRRGKPYKLHHLREPYMKETEGLLIYQEQYMMDCKVFAGWDLAFADQNTRKNKDIKNDINLKEKFIKDSISYSGVSREVAESIWGEIEYVVDGGYGFNKSHSASYSKTAYKTAWLKCYYPIEFYASLLTQNGDDDTEVANIIAEVKNKKIPILPPDINISDDDFAVSDGSIRYRLTTIKHVGKSAIKAIRKLRPIKDFEDLIKRSEKRHLRKNTVESLIKAGVFDKEEPNRIKMLNRFYELRDIDSHAPDSMFTPELKYAFEKESMGTYLSGHPIEEYSYQDITDFPNGDIAVLGGQVTSVTRVHDKKGNPMAFVDISNESGVFTAVVFSYIWTDKRMNTQEVLKENNLVEVIGKRDGDNILLNKCKELR